MTRVKVTYKANKAGIGEFLLSHGVYEGVKTKADDGKAFAEAISPVGKPPEDKSPGLFRASWRVEESFVIIRGKPRVAAKLLNDAPYAAAVEWGWGGTKANPHTAKGAHLLIPKIHDHLRE